MLEQAQLIDVTAEHLDARGDGVAHCDGVTLVVPGLLPGERAQVRVTHVSKRSSRAWGLLKVMHRAMPQHREPPCQHHQSREQGQCGGCPLMIAERDHQVKLKQDSLARSLKREVESIRVGERELGYRWSSKRVVGGSTGRLVLGSYVRGSHRVAAMHDCLVDHPDIAACAREVERASWELGIEPYDEQAQTGDLRYVWLKTDGRGKVLVTLISATEDSQARELAARLDGAAGVTWCVQGGAGNVIRGEHLQPLCGEQQLTIELCGHTITVGPLDFLQPNPAVAELAYRDLVGDDSGSLAFDLYAGAGVTTALLREHFERVVPCEKYPEAAEKLGVEPQSAEDFLRDGKQSGQVPELVVANPPRAGLGDAVCQALNALAQKGTKTLRIMSCHPLSLARDLDRLTEEAGGYSVSWLRAYDTLPHTAHLELVVSLQASATS